MDKISNSLKFFVNNGRRSVILIYQVQFCDLANLLSNFLGYCLGCWTKGNFKAVAISPSTAICPCNLFCRDHSRVFI